MRDERSNTLSEFQVYRGIAILRAEDQNQARLAMQAAVDGGFRLLEFTLTTPGACQLIAEFSILPGVVVGAGTVMSKEQAHQAAQAGARFLVSPVCDPEVIREGKALGAVTVPGTFTANEMIRAHEAGADLLKLFPAPSEGPEYVRALLGPLPHLRIVPTSGVTPENFTAFLRAGAFAVGFTSCLFPKEELTDGKFDQIRERAGEIITRLK